MVQEHESPGRVGVKPLQTPQAGLLGLFNVRNYGCGCPYCQGHTLAAIRLQRSDAKARFQRLLSFPGAEQPLLQGGDAARGQAVRNLPVPGKQRLGGADAFKLQGQVIDGNLGGGELAGGYIHVGQAGLLFLDYDRGQEVVGALLQ